MERERYTYLIWPPVLQMLVYNRNVIILPNEIVLKYHTSFVAEVTRTLMIFRVRPCGRCKRQASSTRCPPTRTCTWSWNPTPGSAFNPDTSSLVSMRDISLPSSKLYRVIGRYFKNSFSFPLQVI